MSDAERGGAGIVMTVGVNNNKNNKGPVSGFVGSIPLPTLDSRN